MKWNDFWNKHNIDKEGDVPDEIEKIYEDTDSTKNQSDSSDVGDNGDRNTSDKVSENIQELTKAVNDLKEANRELSLLGTEEPPQTFDDALLELVGLKK